MIIIIKWNKYLMINFYKIIIKFKFCVKLPNFIYLSIKDFNNYVGNYINIII